MAATGSTLLKQQMGQLYDLLVGGVDLELAGNGGGYQCATFRSPERKVFETVAVLGLTASLIIWAMHRIRANKDNSSDEEDDISGVVYSPAKQLLLIIFCLMFGIQIGFKFATRQLIWLLLPCHVTTCMQIYLLATKPDMNTKVLFRIHVGFLHGAVLALAFPVLDTYKLPCEVEMYWIQHILMLVPPIVLSQSHPVYDLEPITQVYYTCITHALFFDYLFIILQPIAILTNMNLTFILCPAPTDPFAGPNYVFHAMWYLFVVMVVVTKLLHLLVKLKNISKKKYD